VGVVRGLVVAAVNAAERLYVVGGLWNPRISSVHAPPGLPGPVQVVLSAPAAFHPLKVSPGPAAAVKVTFWSKPVAPAAAG